MGKNRGEERCEVDSASLLAQFGAASEQSQLSANTLPPTGPDVSNTP